MNELLIPIVMFSVWTAFSVVYIWIFKKTQTNKESKSNSFWNNAYIFETIPSVFPTLGIFCTALGITIGIWDFDTKDIEGSIPELLKGLRLAFVATMAGIIGLIIFQKVNAIVQKTIDVNPNRPKKQTDELTAIAELTFAIQKLKEDGQIQTEILISAVSEQLERKVFDKLGVLEKEIINLKDVANANQELTDTGLKLIDKTTSDSNYGIMAEIGKLREVTTAGSEKANKNTDDIIKAMRENNKLTSKKFDEFSDLLRKNNTEALVLVMKSATEQFNQQMGELINKLVQENFAELNNSVKSLNNWQLQNKDQVQKLTENFQRTTEMFEISSKTLSEVAANTKGLTDSDSKLSQIVKELSKVMIEDGKFQKITEQLSSTVNTLETTTESFEETTAKLNDWIRNEHDFKEATEILISKLEEFRDFNGDVWDKYRKEMSKSVSIIKDSSSRLSEDLENINSEFYSRLNDTLQNLDQCIARFVPTTKN
jgi:hypothetical protein